MEIFLFVWIFKLLGRRAWMGKLQAAGNAGRMDRHCQVCQTGSSVILVRESFSRSAVACGWFEKSRVRLSGDAWSPKGDG